MEILLCNFFYVFLLLFRDPLVDVGHDLLALVTKLLTVRLLLLQLCPQRVHLVGDWKSGSAVGTGKEGRKALAKLLTFSILAYHLFLGGGSEEGRWMEGKTLQTPTHSPYRHGNSLVHWPEHAQRLGQTQIRVPNVWPHGFRQTLPNRMITPTAKMSEYQQSAPGDSDQGPTRAKY